MSPGKDQEYFSDGIAEEILNALAQVDGLRVAGRTSAFSFKGKNEDLASIARKLNVATLLEGSVRKSGNRVRITAQLISAKDGFHLWSKQYDRELTDIFKIQGELAMAVVEALKVKLLPGAPVPFRLQPAKDPEAYRLVLLGRSLLLQQTEESQRRAVETLGPGGAPAPGDVVLSWIPGPTPDEDALACHRLPANGTRDASVDGELLGRVTLLARDGTTRPLPGRVGDLARSFGPLVALPMLRMAGR